MRPVPKRQVATNKLIGYRKLRLYLVFILCLIGNRLALSQPNPSRNVPFAFTIAAATRTSAGVFTKDGTLVRTLWSGKTYSAGVYQEYWDRIDDEGRLVSDGIYDIKLLSNNVQYTWEGVIANTSVNTVGNGRHTWTDRIYDIRIIGNYAYFVAGYQEGQPSQHKFNLSSPNRMEEIWSNPADSNGSGLMSFVLCNDATTIYWAGYHISTGTSCIWATFITTGAEVKFPGGKVLSNSYGRSYASVIDTVAGSLNAVIKGVAVSTNYIFVARPGLNSIHVLNKLTGTLAQTLTFTAPRSLYVDAKDELWMVHSGGVTKHTINSNGTLSAPIMNLSGLSDALSLQVSPDNNSVLIGDGGLNHVYKGFSNTNGQLLWTIGKPGGYSTSPDVSYDKFIFRAGKEWRAGRDNGDATFGAFLPDGSMWLGDMGNQRLLHFADDRTTVIDEIMAMGYNYEVSVNRAEPNRVFCNYLEFDIDYSKPLQAMNGSWKLKRNWAWNVNAAYDSQFNRTRNSTTLSNGRTYNIGNTLTEYTPAGIRYGTIAGLSASDGAYSLYADGSLWSASNGGVGQTIQYKRRALTGFDGNNNPIYASPVTVETTPTITTKDPVGHAMGGWNCDQYTSSNILVTFASEAGQILGGQVRGLGYHLGGLKNGKWLWRTAKATTKNYTGIFPPDGGYDIGNSVQYAGNIVTTLERNVFWGYNGEFWKASQTNKYNHFYDNGLFVGQFGVVGPETGGVKAYPGFAGNSFVWGVAKVGSDYYMYHADESQHGGVHRWKISNLSSIQEQVFPVNVNSTLDTHGLTADYFNGSDLNNFNSSTTRVDPTIDFDWKAGIPSGTTLSDPANFSIRWEGFVQPSFSENYTFYLNTFGGVRLWIDGNLLIDKFSTNTATLYTNSMVLEAGKRYPIRVEYRNINNSGSVSLSWSSNHQVQAKIPTASLYPVDPPDRSKGFNLMEGTFFNSTLENGLYGWSRNPVSDYYTGGFDYWKAITNVQTLNHTNPDLHIELRPGTNGLTTTVRRDLGTPSTLPEWSVTGKLIWPKEDQDFVPNNKGYFEIVDINDKLIARINRTFDPYPIARLYGNDKILLQARKDSMSALTGNLQPFAITVKNNKVTFQYGSLAPIATTVLDPESKWQQPKTLRIVYYSATNREHNMDMAEMRFNTGTTLTDPTLTGGKQALIVTFPNPAQHELQVVYPTIVNTGSLTIISINGKELRAWTLETGSTTTSMDISFLPEGVYFIKYRNSSQLLITRFVKQ